MHLPATVRGTVVDADTQDGEAVSACDGGAASVWYRIDPGVSRRIV
ncbi:MAG: hypothetical protein QOK31_1105, partial [Solirubrobacteraceae bacterium]|nr:hypothetical protein [Solirubrobacteraceae bacterium]